MLVGRLVVSLLLVLPVPAIACGVTSDSGRIVRVNDAAEALTVTFLGHASFLIETPQHVTVVTDYNGVNIPESPPEIATMNHAHSTHYTDYPDPRIGQVLRGWRDDGKPAQWDVTLRDMHIRNIPTNTRGFGGSDDGGWGGGTRMYGNSIFVFESAGLCIAHLSHLHHLLTPDDLAALGQVDVVMAPVDGYWTLSHKDIAEVLRQIHAPLVIPFHYFTTDILQRFLDTVRDEYDIQINPSPTTVISQESLPSHPEILVLPGGY